MKQQWITFLTLISDGATLDSEGNAQLKDTVEPQTSESAETAQLNCITKEREENKIRKYYT